MEYVDQSALRDELVMTALDQFQTRSTEFTSPLMRRRELLRVGALYGAGVTLPHLLAARKLLASDTTTRVAKSCIMIWLDGGPSHIDTFDPKPEAPAEVRGPFGAIATCVPGVQVSELFPKLAARMDRVALVRSMTSPLGEHNLGATYLLTGYRPSPVVRHPSFLSTLSWHLDQQTLSSSGSELPSMVAVPNNQVGGADFSWNGFLQSRYSPFSIDSDPSQPDFSVRNLTLDAGSIDRLKRRLDYRSEFADGARVDSLTSQAFALLSSPSAKAAFELTRESESTRRNYGPKSIGQSCLLARRLIEAGVPLVTVVNHGWDTHADVVTRLRDGYTGAQVPVGLGPSLDQALSALLDDLQERGLAEDTLVVVMGEFGRTPKWNPSGGRDHWPRVFSVLLAGGPISGGVCRGTSDRHGESPADNAVTPADLCHTIFAAMGMDSAQMLKTPDGRAIAAADATGGVIQGLFA